MKKQKNEETLVVVEERVGNTPEKKFRAGSVSATVWANQGKNQAGDPTEYKTISLERNYTDKDGKWQSTNSFRINDLPKAKLALAQAYEFLVLSA